MATRREVIAAAGGLVLSACSMAPPTSPVQSDAARKIAEIESRIGGRIGVFAINDQTMTSIAYRYGERFAMASTFKWILAALVLKQAEAGKLKLDQRLSYAAGDILPNSPITPVHLAEGGMTIEALCEAIITVSDNTGANLLLDQVGGPEGVTKFLRASADHETRLDRRELELNQNLKDDPRDTTTPMAMALLAERLLLREWLPKDAQQKLYAWLMAATPGLNRLRAGLPKDWRAGDKTGTGGNGAFNDVCVAWPPGRRPIVIACYMSESAAPDEAKAAAHADIARIIVAEWT